MPPIPTIADHGLIGDLRTGALVALDGTIDFLCAPDFDSPSVFASLLTPDGGHFAIAPTTPALRTTQLYLPETAILLTRFLAADGIAELSDYMPVCVLPGSQRIVRRISVVVGTFEFAMRCAPRPDYGRAKTKARREAGGVAFMVGDHSAHLSASLPIDVDGRDAVATFTLEAGQSACFVLSTGGEHTNPGEQATDFKATIDWWHAWTATVKYDGRWREMVVRSAITLKLMTSVKQSAPIAALTFGLPEQPGGQRNWDYRYCWIRDGSFAMYALVRLGLTDEALGFLDWTAARMRESGLRHDEGAEVAPLRLMYTIDGGEVPAETTLDAFEGYGGARPVRLGNGARDQTQNDIFGELLDTVYLANKYGRASSWADWQDVCRIVAHVGRHWRDPDQGIWEGRGEPKQFLHSRLMCWVAVDRALRLADRRSYPAPADDWNKLRAEIQTAIHTDHWNEALNSFVQYPGGTTPDGSMLLMPLVRFIDGHDPRWLGTMALIERSLVQDALVFRRAAADRALDGLTGSEGCFLACAFWYTEALARSGDVAQARLNFDKLLGYANHVGLFAEELAISGDQLGNFPQMLTHLALISAASYIDRALSGKPPIAWG